MHKRRMTCQIAKFSKFTSGNRQARACSKPGQVNLQSVNDVAKVCCKKTKKSFGKRLLDLTIETVEATASEHRFEWVYAEDDFFDLKLGPRIIRSILSTPGCWIVE